MTTTRAQAEEYLETAKKLLTYMDNAMAVENQTRVIWPLKCRGDKPPPDKRSCTVVRRNVLIKRVRSRPR